MSSRRRKQNKPLRSLAFTRLVAALALAAPAPGHAAGFALQEWGAQAMGMANAVVALANTPSAVAFNPAGLVQLEGLSFEAGVTMINPGFAYTLPAPGTTTEVEVEADGAWFPIPSVYAAYRLHDRVAVGVGLYSVFGLGISWDTTVSVPGEQAARAWWGRGMIEEIELSTAHITPTVAIKLHERVLLGGGLALVKAAVTLKRPVTLSASVEDDVGFELSGEDFGLAGTGGLLIDAVPHLLKIAFAYRGGLKMSFEGDAVFTNVPEGLRGLLVDSKAVAEASLPHTFTFGVAATPLTGLTVGLAVDLQTWSSYEELVVRVLDEEGADNADLSTRERKDWHNTLAVRLGAEYYVTKQLPLRAGLGYDQSPVPAETVSPELPDADRYQLSLGAGYRAGGLSVDVAYLFVTNGESETAPTAPLVGRYSGSGHLLGLSLGYQLDL